MMEVAVNQPTDKLKTRTAGGVLWYDEYSDGPSTKSERFIDGQLGNFYKSNLEFHCTKRFETVQNRVFSYCGERQSLVSLETAIMTAFM